jgi:2-keto-4-pentenoate hydratase
MSDTKEINRIANELKRAQATCTQVDPLTERYPHLTVADAYAIQLLNIQERLAAGERVVGKKIGLTSKGMQNLLGVYEPDYGHLLHPMAVPNGETIPAKKLIQPRCEGEIAFLLKRDLQGPGVTSAEVLSATEAVLAALEIVDSRVRDWKIKLVDTVADNASSGMLVLGNKLVSPANLDLRLVGMVFEKNGEMVNNGAGAAVLGHPASAVAWLANKLAEFEVTLKAGEVILSGALTAAAPAAAGDCFQAEFDHLGSVAVKFV